MKITFVRHAEVEFKWKRKYNSSEFNLACLEYDRAPVKVSKEIIMKDELVVYISDLQRTRDTINSHTLGNRKVKQTSLLNEIPMTSFIETEFELPTIVWMILARIQWYFNSKRQLERREESVRRINNFLNTLEEEQQDCLIVGHGFFFAQMITELKKRDAIGNMKRRINNEELREYNFISTKTTH